MTNTEVIIVGAGPTGLMAGILLTLAGVQVRIFDKAREQAHESRAFGVQPKSLELLLSIGLVDEFFNHGMLTVGTEAYVNGKRVAELNFNDIGRNDTPYSFVLMVAQSDIEKILATHLQQQGIHIEHECEIIDFTQSATGIDVQIKNSHGKIQTIKANYLIGADGAHSIVRKKLGLTYEGAPYPQGFLLADCKVDWSLDYDHMKLFLHEKNLAVYLPLHGREYARIIAVQPFHAPTTQLSKEASSAEPATLNEVQAALNAAAQLPIKLSNPVWVSRYRIHHRSVNKYGERRVFVAGDAAHIHSPAGGQGMNTGLQDAANLAWKIAVTLRGQDKPNLLATYHMERWPVGQKILHTTDKLFAGMSTQKAWAAKLRTMLVPILFGAISRIKWLRRRLFNFISQLGIRYRNNNFLCNNLSATTPHAFRHWLPAGNRAPNALIERNRDVFSLIGGYCFHVLAISKKPLSAQEIADIVTKLAVLPSSIGIAIKTHVITNSLIGRDPRIIQVESSDVFERYGLNYKVPQAIYLIRPDGYIAYRSNSWDIGKLAEFIGKFK